MITVYIGQDFRELKAEGYKPGWYPDAVHTESGAALWLDAHSSLAHWQQVGCSQAPKACRAAMSLDACCWEPLASCLACHADA